MIINTQNGLLLKIVICIALILVIGVLPGSSAGEEIEVGGIQYIKRDFYIETGSSSLEWLDFDNDGDLDVLEVRASQQGVDLYENNEGEFTFKQRLSITSFAVSMADYDNDGDIDLVLGDYLQDEVFGYNLWRNFLYINDNGVYVKDKELPDMPIESMAWGDYDNDGDLDLAMVNGVNKSNYLLRNDDGDLVPQKAFGKRFCETIVWGDFDNDGDLDLALGNDYGYQNKLYVNNNGTFTAKDEFGKGITMTMAAVDIDDDNDLDVIVGNYARNTEGQNYLYLNDNGNFTGNPNFGKGKTQSICPADFDKDGDIDIAIGNSKYLSDKTPSYMYINNNGKYIQFELDRYLRVEWLRALDFESDGDLDIAMATTDGLFILNNVKDSDRDGLDDTWETMYFASLKESGANDVDSDEFTNLEEYLNDTDPTDYNDYPYVDTDGDSVEDKKDAFPDDPDEYIDTDGDGVGDNADEFDNNSAEWIDSDLDGVGNNSDAFPEDPAASLDTDGDGYPDEWNEGRTELHSTTGLIIDEYPEDPAKWKKEASDGASENNSNLTILLIIIIVIIIVVVLLLFLNKRRSGAGGPGGQQLSAMQQPPKQPPVQQTPQHVPQPQYPGQEQVQNNCPSCHQPCSYINEHRRYYCYNCQKYI